MPRRFPLGAETRADGWDDPTRRAECQSCGRRGTCADFQADAVHGAASTTRTTTRPRRLPAGALSRTSRGSAAGARAS